MAKKMNAYMTALQKARKSGAASFSYNGKTYVKKKTKTGLVVYKAKWCLILVSKCLVLNGL